MRATAKASILHEEFGGRIACRSPFALNFLRVRSYEPRHEPTEKRFRIGLKDTGYPMNILPSAIHAAPADDRWEAAYIRFETSEQEIQKFLRRLRLLGVPSLARDSQIVELFCG